MRTTQAPQTRTRGNDATDPDAATIRHANAGEVRWMVSPTNRTNVPYDASQYCPVQQLSLWKEETLSVSDPSSAGFVC
jgi:hypothetical protein